MLDLDPEKISTKLDGWSEVLRKHWKLLILVLFGYIVYWFAGVVNEEMENPTEEPQQYEEVYDADYDEIE